MFKQISAKGELVLHAIVNVAGNSLIITALPQLLPASIVAVIFLVFNVAQVVYAFKNPTYAVHLIQTGQLTVPPKADTSTQ